MERVPAWGWVVVGGVVAVVAGVLLWGSRDGLGAPEPADWRMAPSGESLGPGAKTVPIEVRERDCASGRPADGRIEATVTYRDDVLVIDVGVRPLEGDHDCPSNPVTPYVVQLDQPVGDREIRGERWREP